MTDRSTRDSAFRAAAHSAVVCRPTGLATIRIDGDDAEAFLQGQLSSDVAALAPGKSQWSSYNSAKGRMLASLRLWRGGDGGYGLLLSADLASAMTKRLSMFVLRAKVRLTDRSSTHATIGIGGQSAASAIEATLGPSPGAGDVIDLADRHAALVGLADGRFVLVAEASGAASMAAALAKDATTADEATWRWLSITSGVPLVTAATSDRFVPQMLNWDALQGISFQKGCYPGQEIVARMRYLGRLKERLYGFHVAAPSEPQPGARIYSEAFGPTPCGTVVNAAPAPDGGYALLAVVQIGAIDAGSLALDTEDGPPLVRVALPYTVPEAAPTRSRLG
jgi:tRNA-modifying protein YgfZ